MDAPLALEPTPGERGFSSSFSADRFEAMKAFLLLLLSVAADVPWQAGPTPNIDIPPSGDTSTKVARPFVEFTGTDAAPLPVRVMVNRDESGLAITRLWTNTAPYVVMTQRVEAINTPCPECGQPNHHQREIVLMGSSDTVYVELVYAGVTNTFMLHGEIRTNIWTVTNVVPLAGQRTQPGWSGPPLPPGVWTTNSAARFHR